MDAILVENLIKTYSNGKNALNGITFSVKKGEIFSLLGMNGAGKTTLIHILTTYLQSTSGKAFLLGKNCNSEKDYIRSKIACVSQRLSIDEYLTFQENLIFQSRLYGLDRNTLFERSERLLKIFELEQYLHTKVKSCSGGVKRKLDIVMNMITYPEILFLDEPTVALDIHSRRSMWKMLKTIKEQLRTTIILTTHYLEEADILSDTICFIKDGKIVNQGTPQALKNYLKPNVIRIHLNENHFSNNDKQTLLRLDCINSIRITDRQVDIFVSNSNNDFKLINQKLLELNIDFVKIEIVEPTIDEVFISIMEERGHSNESI